MSAADSQPADKVSAAILHSPSHADRKCALRIRAEESCHAYRPAVDANANAIDRWASEVTGLDDGASKSTKVEA